MDFHQPGATPLIEEFDWGADPGALRMFTYVPPGLAVPGRAVPGLAVPSLAVGAPLVVVLHGCTQTAASYDHGAGWSTLAERYGFALLLPEQQRSNNPNGCFNWFQSGDIERGRGEAASIRHMVEHMVRHKGIDRSRVFVTGLSAGGAMTSVMLACYPEVFAGGAIIAGLPYGAADNVQQAFQSMLQSPARPAEEWGNLVRGASEHRGRWPRVSVWHGAADKTVVPSNAREILKQWTNVHGVPMEPSEQSMVNGYPRQVWRDETGEERIEFYAIARMAHGTPLAPGQSDEECGTAGPFLLDVGISSSYHIAHFFGLADAGNVDRPDRDPAMTPKPKPEETDAPPHAPAPWHDRRAPAASSPLPILDGEILEPGAEVDRRFGRMPPRQSVPIGSVITSALKAAGLMKKP
ncbi:extracellular catalytic domain type 1 short-chain-length polyhydroxyalkanoate depolymerase [Astrobacterium formosum]|uniref:extracellular catalytic domain type 1 short-chain-length polyhydroxyalkanoate depolymerase n=1 Tax=Astrobacterium formosum TaxID=3069710 RepID=UPI003F50A0A9